MHASSTNWLTLGQDRALYLGELPATGLHRHVTPVLLIGLSGRFAVRLADGTALYCYSALVDAGVEHVFDPCGERVALMYLEPDSSEARALRPLFRQAGPVIADPAMRPVSKGSFERHLNAFDLETLLGAGCIGMPQTLDARIARSLASLRAMADNAPNRGLLATEAGLSESRFNHLFRAEMGVSFRSYRIWSQLRATLEGYRYRGSLTDAALAGGFVDSAHFSRIFRQTFAMTPSSVLKPLQGLTLL